MYFLVYCLRIKEATMTASHPQEGLRDFHFCHLSSDSPQRLAELSLALGPELPMEAQTMLLRLSLSLVLAIPLSVFFLCPFTDRGGHSQSVDIFIWLG